MFSSKAPPDKTVAPSYFDISANTAFVPLYTSTVVPSAKPATVPDTTPVVAAVNVTAPAISHAPGAEITIGPAPALYISLPLTSIFESVALTAETLLYLKILPSPTPMSPMTVSATPDSISMSSEPFPIFAVNDTSVENILPLIMALLLPEPINSPLSRLLATRFCPLVLVLPIVTFVDALTLIPCKVFPNPAVVPPNLSVPIKVE